MANKVITLLGLGTFWEEIKSFITGQNFDTTTGSQAKADKALSDAKAYVDGKGYATTGDVDTKVTAATAGMVTDEALTAKGYQTSEQVDAAVSAKGFQTEAQVEATVTGKGFQNAEQVAAAVTKGTEGLLTEDALAAKGYATGDDVTKATAGMVTETALDAKGFQTADNVKTSVDAAKAELQTAIDTAVSSAYKTKGSCAFADLPALADAKIGDVWDISEDFVTTDDFVEGAGVSYTAHTNAVRVNHDGKPKWDALAGIFDSSKFVTTDQFQEATEEDIRGLFPKATTK